MIFLHTVIRRNFHCKKDSSQLKISNKTNDAPVKTEKAATARVGAPLKVQKHQSVLNMLNFFRKSLAVPKTRNSFRKVLRKESSVSDDHNLTREVTLKTRKTVLFDRVIFFGSPVLLQA